MSSLEPAGTPPAIDATDPPVPRRIAAIVATDRPVPRRAAPSSCRRSRPLIHWAGLCTLLLLWLSSGVTLGAAPVQIRVLVGEGLKEASIRGLDLSVQDAETELEVKTDDLGGGNATTLRFGVRDGALTLNGRTLANRRIRVASPALFVHLNDREYRGPLELRIDGDRIQVIDHLGLEQYLSATVAGEMPASWPLEALKAQAVVARSYAWKQIQKWRSRSYDVVADVRDQVFPGSEADRYMTVQAVRFTEGIVLVRDGEVVETFYHSTCGGATEVASNVWPDRSQTLPGVTCGYCKLSPASRWVAELGAEELAGRLREAGFQDDRVTGFDVVRRSPSGRALEIRISGEKGQVTIDGNTLRRLVGYDRIKSARFVSQLGDRGLRLEGEGFGHGVGMCQWGARGMALAGKKVEDILEFYYPGTQRAKLGTSSERRTE